MCYEGLRTRNAQVSGSNPFAGSMFFRISRCVPVNHANNAELLRTSVTAGRRSASGPEDKEVARFDVASPWCRPPGLMTLSGKECVRLCKGAR